VVAAGLESAQQLELVRSFAEQDHRDGGVAAGVARADRPHERERRALVSEPAEHDERRAVVAEPDARLPLGLGAERLVAVGSQVVEHERTGIFGALGDEQRRGCVVHSTLLSLS
jgi:hypothetical protein